MIFGGKKPAPENAPPSGDGAGESPLAYSDKDKARAREWFRKGDDCREKRDYDYAVESYLTGLGYWPEAVEEGHMKLRSIAIQRQQAGGKKPGMLDRMKWSTSGKDVKVAMLNAEKRVSLDPTDDDAWDAFVKNAGRGRFFATLLWAAPLASESLKRDKKPSLGRFRAFREALVEASDASSEMHDNITTTKLLEAAMDSLDYLRLRIPGDEGLRNEQRHLAGKLAIAKGKYEEADTFRDSLQDADKQTMMHDAERGSKQADESLERALAALRNAWKQDPQSPGPFNQLIDALARTEKKKFEDEAIELLKQQYIAAKQYAHKVRADNILMAQRKRELRGLKEAAIASGNEDDKRNVRLSEQDFNQTRLEIYRERLEKYPTDLRIKYELGTILLTLQLPHEAIPLLQDAQADPKVRFHCQFYIGRAFFDTGAHGQAVSVLREALAGYEYTDDLTKRLLYWLGRACEADQKIPEAKDAYGKLMRLDYNYADGDVRRRMELLNKTG